MANPEARIQADILAYLRAALPDSLPHHSPNGGLRNKREAAKLKWQGVLPGYPDLTILRPGGKHLLLEVKAPGGVLSPSQLAFKHYCETHEIPYAVVKSVDDVRAALERWKVQTREAA